MKPLEIQSREMHITPVNLEILREQINKADEQLLKTLWWRIDTAKRIGEYKRENQLEILQTKRWEELLKHRLGLAKNMGLDTSFVEKLYLIIHEESLKVQRRV